MTETTVTALMQPGEFCDQLTSVLRSGAQALLTQAIEAEVTNFMASHAQEQLDDGRARLVRHGHLPEREIQTGIGAIKIRQPRVRDRAGKTRDRLLFLPTVAPKYMRRSKSLDALIPWLYLKGVSSGDFQAALSALLGADAPNLSGDTVLRLRKVWQGELSAFERRDLSARNYVYIWADGVYFQAPMEQESQCMLVIIGATPEGKKELVGFIDGYRESTQSWRELLLDLKTRGLKTPPKLARYCQIWCMSDHDQAAAWLVSVTSTPSLNLTPVMTLAKKSNPRNRRHFFSAHWPSLNIMCSMPSRVRQPFERLVRWRMVPKLLSIITRQGMFTCPRGRVGCSDTLPVLGRKIKEGHQLLAVLLQAESGLGIFGVVGLDE